VDNLTHTLVGLMMSRSGIDRKVERAAPLMMLAANAPDIDTVSLFGGAATYLEWHRAYVHSLAIAPVLALLPPLILWVSVRQRITAWAYAFSLAGVLSHLLLDWTNVYGIRMLLPFSARWLRLDSTDVVDPWIWAILLLAVAAPAFARMVSSEIASHSIKSGPKFGWAWFALLALIAYDGGRYVAHARALGVMGARLYYGTIPRRISAMPGPNFNPLRWKGIVEGDTFASSDSPSQRFVIILPVSLTDTFDPEAGRTDYDAIADTASAPAIAAARATPAFETFASFDQLPFWKTTLLDEGTRVELIDLRFGTPQHPGFEASAKVDASGSVHDGRVSMGGRPGRTD
jgi:inner membrane protein